MNVSSIHSMYFVALVCPPALDEKVLRFKNWMKAQFGCVVALRSPGHITLVPPFWLEEWREAELHEALRSFTGNIDEVDISLDGFSHFDKRVLFVQVKDNSPLGELRADVGSHFIELFGEIIKEDKRPFHPHITIANRDMKPGDFEKAWSHFSQKEFKETFRATTISLLKLKSGKWNVIGEKNLRVNI